MISFPPRNNPASKEKRKRTINTKKRILATSEVVAERPPNPNTPARSEKTKKISDHLNITKSF